MPGGSLDWNTLLDNQRAMLKEAKRASKLGVWAVVLSVLILAVAAVTLAVTLWH